MRNESTSSNTTMAGTENDIEIVDSPNTIVSAMEFSPYKTIRKNILAASRYDLTVRLWEVRRSRKTERKWVISMPSQILDVTWSIDGKTLCMASSDNKLKFLDSERPYLIADAKQSHNEPIWDTRCNGPVVNINLPDKIACADVDDTMAVVCTEDAHIYVLELGAVVQVVSDLIPPFQSQRRSVAIFRDRRTGKPAGFTMGTTQGHVFTIYNYEPNHDVAILRSHDATNTTMTPSENTSAAVNDIKYHPVHQSLAVIRANGHYSFYNMEPPRPNMLSDKSCQREIMKCRFNKDGTIFAYNTGPYFSKMPIPTPTSIFFNYGCFNEMDPAVYYLNYF